VGLRNVQYLFMRGAVISAGGCFVVLMVERMWWSEALNPDHTCVTELRKNIHLLTHRLLSERGTASKLHVRPLATRIMLPCNILNFIKIYRDFAMYTAHSSRGFNRSMVKVTACRRIAVGGNVDRNNSASAKSACPKNF